MSALIDQYFVKHLELDQESATKLHEQYYQTYGLAVEGLVRHHKINALDFNAQVDDALPLERILSPEPELRRLLESIDRTKVKLWLFTNAYVNHGRRVVKILGVEDLFEGLTYCDYGAHPFICKPMPAMFEKAFEEAGATKAQDCFFVGQ
jgi:pyrimidine and pyridine-specific 5'-nucleotidase